MKRFKSVQAYFDSLEKWPDELNKLREIVLSVGIEETLKWGGPVYVANGKNVAGLFAAKNHFALWFYQGALLADKEGVLMSCQDTKALRQWRFTSAKQIKTRLIKKYLLEAIALAEQGKAIKPDRNKPIVVPPELKKALSANKKAKTCFEKLNKTCRREYAEYISDAKREQTKSRRIEKIIPMILNSVGLNDKYRK